MAIDWKIVRAEHVERACDLASGKPIAQKPTRGLFLIRGDSYFPAKDVARVAYLLAAGKSPDSTLHFASGEATLNFLRRLGFEVERFRSPKKEPASAEK